MAKRLIGGLVGLALLGVAGQALAVPIASTTPLVTGVTQFGQVGLPGFSGSPADTFYTFSGIAAASTTLTVNRLEAALDPLFRLFFGTGADTAVLDFITFRDDNLPELSGFVGPAADPQLLNFLLPSTGIYTVQVSSFASGSPGIDGLFDFQITLGTPPTGQVVFPVPEPSTLAIFAVGLAGMGFLTRRRRTGVGKTRHPS